MSTHFLPLIAQAGPAPAATSLSMFVMIPVFVLLMYFMVIRPQSKRAKDQRELLDRLNRGDEVITTGGIAGTVVEIGENFITIEAGPGVRLRVQRAAINAVLPKGTLKNA